MSGKSFKRIGASMSVRVSPDDWGGHFEPDAETLRKIAEIDAAYARSARSIEPFGKRTRRKR